MQLHSIRIEIYIHLPSKDKHVRKRKTRIIFYFLCLTYISLARMCLWLYVLLCACAGVRRARPCMCTYFGVYIVWHDPCPVTMVKCVYLGVWVFYFSLIAIPTQNIFECIWTKFWVVCTCPSYFCIQNIVDLRLHSSYKYWILNNARILYSCFDADESGSVCCCSILF